MSTDLEPISVRTTRLNNLILGHSNATSKTSKTVADGLSREGLLDALCLLYNQCNKEQMKKRDKTVHDFVSKYRSIMKETGSLRISVNDFMVKDLIGKGYFGDVHLVREKATFDAYAMKKIKKTGLTTAQVKEERDIMTRRDSEWITFLQYAFQDADNLYLVMEYLPGGDLLSLMIRNGPFDENLAKFYLAELTMAINALHVMGYVHRDIKPENILIDRFGHIKLADFGNAASLDKTGHVTSMSPVGTPDYIAPELLQTISATKLSKSVYDVSCDYWSMGVIGYELICETTPFHEDNVHETYSKILSYCDDGRAEPIKFPDDIPISSKFKNLIENLVTKPSRRLTYLAIIRHGFFEGIDWDNLHQTVPPIIPNVSSEDDISNFEDVDRTKGRRSTFSKQFTTSVKSNDFSGQDLPFLGYGYIHEEVVEQKQEGKREDVKITKLNTKITELQKIIKGHVDDAKTLHEKLLVAERKAAQVDSLNKILRDTRDEMNKMKDKLKDKTMELFNCKSEVKALQGSLRIEEEEREKNDAAIADILKTTYQKWERAKLLSDQNYEKQIAEKKTEISNINQKLLDFENQFIEKCEECSHLQEKVENYKEMLKSIKDQNNIDKIEFEKNKNQLIETYETKISDLKSRLRLEKDSCTKLNDQLRNVRSELDESICSTNSNREAKLVTDKNIEDMKHRLNKEIEENSNLRSKYAAINKKNRENEKICETLRSEIERLKLDQKVAEKRRSYEDGHSDTDSPYQTAHGSLADLNNIEEQLRNDLILAKESEGVQRKRAEQLEQAVNRLEEIITKIQNQPFGGEGILEKQNEKLEDKLASIREQVVIERQSARTANLSMWKMEKQVEDLNNEKKLTLRRMELTEEKIKKVQNEKLELENKLSTASEIISQREARISDLLEEIKAIKTELQKEHSMWERAEQERMKEKSEVLEHVSRVHSLEEKLEEGKTKILQIQQKNDGLVIENKRLHREAQESQEKISNLSENLNKIQMKLKSTQDNYEMLKDACNLTDLQLSEIEVMLDTEVKRNKANTEKIDELYKKLRSKDDEIAKLKIEVNGERDTNRTAQATMRNLQNEVENVGKELEDLRRKFISQQEELITKTKCLFEYQEKFELQSTDVNNLQTMNTNYDHEILILKEENTKILTQMFLAKEEANKLERQLKEAKQTITETKQEIEQLNGTIAEQKNYYVQREIKSEATLAQHKKLIDYLQLKVEELSQKKKKTLADKIFGTTPGTLKKENVSPNAIENSIVYRTLQEELKREKLINEKLKEELRKLKGEYSTENIKAAIEKANETVKKETQKEENAIQSQVQADPMNVVQRGTETTTSKRRSYQTHRFEMTMDNVNTGNAPLICLACKKEILAGHTYWKCKECTGSAHRKCRGDVQTSCDGVKINYRPQVVDDSSDVKSTSSSQTNLSEQAFLSDIDNLMRKDYTGELILKSNIISSGLEINCVFEMDERTILLGCNSGLYAYHHDSHNLVHIGGVDSVSYITVTKSLSKAILVGSRGECLYQCDLRHLKNRSSASAYLKPKLDVSVLDLPFANRSYNEKWHLVKISAEIDHISDAVAVAATSTRIVIMKYDIQLQRFKPVRALDTAMPVSSILFTRHSAIVTSDKFFEIDLTRFSAEEFLDMSDSTLNNTRSYHPMAAFRISPQEFLLCFNECGIFVDEYGCRSRPNDLLWCYKPTGFIYQEPLLYISHYQVLQVIRIHRSYSNAISKHIGDDDDDDEEKEIIRTIMSMNMPVLHSESGKLNCYITLIQSDSNLQELYLIDGLKALKSDKNMSLETLSSQATCLTVDPALSSIADSDTY